MALRVSLTCEGLLAIYQRKADLLGMTAVSVPRDITLARLAWGEGLYMTDGLCRRGDRGVRQASRVGASETKKPPPERRFRSAAGVRRGLLGRVVALRVAGVELARAADTMATGDHLVPVGDPADGA
ncbi:hypothetical protein HHA02_23510 [Cobetia marina]|nr:hypothetical protein HHA02_23510 [Cobetia marina]